MRHVTLALAVLAACGKPAPPPAAGSSLPPARDAAVAATAIHTGTLAPAPRASGIYPSRVCVDGADLVFENACGCDDRLLCHVDAVADHTIAISLRTDPDQPPMCDDCFPMIPGRCPIPAVEGRWAVTINGHPAFELDRRTAGDGACWK